MDTEGDSFYYYGKNRILINALSISGYSIDGYVIVTQNREAGVRMVGTETLSTDKVTPNFLNSMASVITDFFATTLFQVGSYEVTLGVVFAFAICYLYIVCVLTKVCRGLKNGRKNSFSWSFSY